MTEAAWVLEGAYQGLKKLYPDRFDEEGNPQSSCTGGNGETIYGDANCEQVIADYVAANSTPVAPCKGDCSEKLQCYAGNDATGASQTTEALCDLVTLKYGYSQW